MLKRLHSQKDRLLALVDQALIGGGNLVAMALFARILPKFDFGALGAAFGVYYVFYGFQRANIVLPYVLSGKEADTAPESAWAWLALWTSAALAALLGLASLALVWWPAAPAFLLKVVSYSAVMAPALLLQEFARRWLYQGGKAASAAGSSFLSLLVVVAGAGLILALGTAAFGLAPWAFAAGALAASAVAFVRRPIRPSVPFFNFADLWGRRRAFSLWQSLTHVPYVLYNNSYVLLLAFVIGPVAAASFTALRTLLSPTASLISAVDSTDKLRAVRAFQTKGVVAAKASVDKTRIFLLALSVPFLLAVSVLAGPLQSFVFGPQYVHWAEAWVMAIYYLLLAVNQPYETFMIVLERARTLFFTRTLSAIVAVCGLIALAPRYGLLGAVCGLVLAQAVNNLALGLFARREMARARAEAALSDAS